ncbi:MAG: cytochrome c-type biogenesis CcmF C-terminal domain-containing protein, partial [Candidatus Kapaibacterium sp.]
LLIAASACFSLFVNIEIASKLLKSRVHLNYSGGRGNVKAKLISALKWSCSLGLIGLLIASRGDYYKFGDIILAYGLYWVGFLAILSFAFTVIGYPHFKLDKRFLGAYTAHAGLAIFILGVVASARYEKKQYGELAQGQPVKAFGGDYTITYTHHEFSEPENYHFVLQVKDKDGSIEEARPLLFWTAFNNHTEPIRNPGILKYASKDLYFTIAGIDQKGGMPIDSLTKGQTIPVFGGALNVKFDEFDFSAEERAKMMSQQPFRVKANIEVTDTKNPDAKPIPLELSVTRNLKTEEAKEEDVKVPGTSYHIRLSELRPNLEDRSKSKILIRTLDDANPPPPMTEVLTVEAFVKPYINLVWAGILVVVLGFGFSVVRRRREALTAIEKAEKAYEKILALRAASDESKEPMASESHHEAKHLKPKKKDIH